MVGAGALQRQIARTLNAAYAGGLLSDDTFSHRMEELLSRRVIDPGRLIGDLNLRRPRVTATERVRHVIATLTRVIAPAVAPPRMVLALDWSREREELLVGRHRGCDIVLDEPTVSRRHARLVFRDGGWVLHDLGSTNGTAVNGTRVGRCALHPGDSLDLGDTRLRID